MKTSKVGDTLRLAARIVESGQEEFSCWALARAAGFNLNTPATFTTIEPKLAASPAGQAYANLLGRLPTTRDFCDRRWNKQMELDRRVVALCFAATLADNNVTLGVGNDKGT